MMMMMMKAALLLMALSMPMVSTEGNGGNGGNGCPESCDDLTHAIWKKGTEECQCEFSKKTMIYKTEPRDACVDCPDIKKLKNNKQCTCEALGCSRKLKNVCILKGPKYVAPVTGYDSGSGNGGYYYFEDKNMESYGYNTGYGDSYKHYYDDYEHGGYGYGDDLGYCTHEQVYEHYTMGPQKQHCTCEKEKADYDNTYKKYQALTNEHTKVVKEYSEYRSKYSTIAHDEVGEEDADGIHTAAASGSTGALMAILLPMAYWFN